MDIEKAKNDIVYFAEQFVGVRLQSWQKEVLEAIQKGNKIIYIGGNR